MTTSRIPTDRPPFTSPVIDYEPAPVGTPPSTPCPPPSSAALHRRTSRPLRSITAAPAPCPELPPPRAATVFADNALRRVLEVADRRRPVTQLRPLLAPALFDAIATLARTTNQEGASMLRRVRLRTASTVDGQAAAAEMFATYTRGRRVRAIAGRIEITDGRWRVVALQIG